MAYMIDEIRHGRTAQPDGWWPRKWVRRFGWKRSVAVIDGDMIRFKNLMTGSKYTVKLNQLGNISLSTYQTGGRFFAQTINKTTVSFNIENKQIELVLLNSDDWLFGKEISAADIIWVAREEYSRKDENE